MDRILHPETRLLVCDGRKALFLRNGGPAGRPAFEVEQEMHEKGSSHTADLGADEPGRLKSAFGPRSSMEGTDWHQAAEDAFVTYLGERMRADVVKVMGVDAAAWVASKAALLLAAVAAGPRGASAGDGGAVAVRGAPVIGQARPGADLGRPGGAWAARAGVAATEEWEAAAVAAVAV